MPRLRSLVERVEIDQAGRAHNCQGNARHRIQKGDRRLKVRTGRTWEHYCLDCARRIVEKDVSELQALAAGIGDADSG